jgi:hypothetical protein
LAVPYKGGDPLRTQKKRWPGELRAAGSKQIGVERKSGSLGLRLGGDGMVGVRSVRRASSVAGVLRVGERAYYGLRCRQRDARAWISFYRV